MGLMDFFEGSLFIDEITEVEVRVNLENYSAISGSDQIMYCTTEG